MTDLCPCCHGSGWFSPNARSAACSCYEAGRNDLCPIHGSFAGDPTGGYSNLPASAVVQTSAGVCGMHGVYVGRACPKCVTQPKGLA